MALLKGVEPACNFHDMCKQEQKSFSLVKISHLNYSNQAKSYQLTSTREQVNNSEAEQFHVYWTCCCQLMKFCVSSYKYVKVYLRAFTGFQQGIRGWPAWVIDSLRDWFFRRSIIQFFISADVARGRFYPFKLQRHTANFHRPFSTPSLIIYKSFEVRYTGIELLFTIIGFCHPLAN